MSTHSSPPAPSSWPMAQALGQVAGVGIDMVQVSRIAHSYQRFGNAFVQRILHPLERPQFYRRHAAHAERGMRYLASRFAAKEALAKAVGLGIRGPLGWQQMAVCRHEGGGVSWQFFAPFDTWFAQRFSQAHLSLSDQADYALAIVVLNATKE